MASNCKKWLLTAHGGDCVSVVVMGDFSVMACLVVKILSIGVFRLEGSIDYLEDGMS